MDRIESIFSTLFSLNPNPQTELYSVNAYTLLVAVVLSAQSTDKGVNKVTQNLFTQVSSAQVMVNFGEDRLRNEIKNIGLFPTKAKNIIALSKILIEKWKGEVPNNFDDLISLPGVGAKTANVVLNAVFGKPTIPVDTHVFRVSHRLNFSKGKTPAHVEKDLHNVIPDHYKFVGHHLLVLHGRYVCKARYPLCQTCPIRHLCPSFPLTM